MPLLNLYGSLEARWWSSNSSNTGVDGGGGGGKGGSTARHTEGGCLGNYSSYCNVGLGAVGLGYANINKNWRREDWANVG